VTFLSRYQPRVDIQAKTPYKAVNEPTFRTLEQAKYYVRKIEGIIEKSY
jgi:hypothetical protein